MSPLRTEFRQPGRVSLRVLIENISLALDSLRARKLRSALTILGVVIGVTSVIAVASIIDGLDGVIKERVAKLGSRTMFVTRIPASQGPGRLPQKIRMRKYLQDEDARYIEESCPGVAYATVFANRINIAEQVDELRYGDQHVERFLLRGVQPQYAQALPLFAVAEGRFVTQFDEDHARSVIVIGRAIADSLFPMVDPIGKQVRLNGRWYEVIGMFEPDQGLFAGLGVDQFAAIPMSNFRKSFPEVHERFIGIAGREDFTMQEVRDQVEDALRRKRHVPHNAESDFEIADPAFLSKLWDQLTGALVLLTGIISSIGLLVGGIGVMNIMLISVTERTSEIGLRKAVGARKADIRLQFLFEAVALSGIGGIAGILCGSMIAFTVRTALPIPATASLYWVSLGVAIAVGVGLFFGYYPANRAANLDPIECLRYE
jgi:putative ABC transport system permease protein